jgi:hypothetical protein
MEPEIKLRHDNIYVYTQAGIPGMGIQNINTVHIIRPGLSQQNA